MRAWFVAAAIVLSAASCISAPPPDDAAIDARLNALEAEIVLAEDMAAIKKLQKAYGYYLDKGLWADLAELFADDARANYPAGVFIGKASIREHLFKNFGPGQIGLGDGRLYNHTVMQPVVHIAADGRSAQGRWRAFVMMGRYGSSASWAEGIYEIDYVKEGSTWKIRSLDYHSGLGAAYETGWSKARETAAPAVGSAPAAPRVRNLAHPADQPRSADCPGFPTVCIAPFHYKNPVTGGSSAAWTTALKGAVYLDAGPLATNGVVLRRRAADLARRAELLDDAQQIEMLLNIYGYYVDRAQWVQAADLFADKGTLEAGLAGVYVGKNHIRQFLALPSPGGPREGWLNDHLHFQAIVDVAPDGKTALARSREIGMTGEFGGKGQWSEGIYENTFIKESDVWKIASLRFYPTFFTDYDEGWGKSALPPPGPSVALPPDRPPSETYQIYPKAHVAPLHFANPVTGRPTQYPAGMTAPALPRETKYTPPAPPAEKLDALLAEAEREVARVKDRHEIENLENAYGYYLDKSLWNQLADLFAESGSMELAQRGVYVGRERVREFLPTAFGQEGPKDGRLGNHIQMQPVISVSDDGLTARIRIRLVQQMGQYGQRASWGGGIYENTAVKENGVWKFQSVHMFNTFTADYAGGWAKSPGTRVPGPSTANPPDKPPTVRFEMFPRVYDIPYHYRNPVTGQ
jgi:hypothetical protein